MRPLHDPAKRGFVSDNCAGVHPAVMAAMAEADGGHEASYGADRYTAQLTAELRDRLGPSTGALPVFNGTGANVLSLMLIVERGGAVLCAESAHLATSECAAPELHGVKLVPVPAPDGRIDPAGLREVALGLGRSRARPVALSISQTTELGTCYSVDHLQALTREARRLGLRVHLDGARLANAGAHLGFGLVELLDGVDVASFGASKNGGMFGECVVVRDPVTTGADRWLHKAVTQLPSKTRFVSAQLLALLEADLWLENAALANLHAKDLSTRLAHLSGVNIVHDTEANAVFAQVPRAAWSVLEGDYGLTPWPETSDVARLMTAYDTEQPDVDLLLVRLRDALSA